MWGAGGPGALLIWRYQFLPSYYTDWAVIQSRDAPQKNSQDEHYDENI
jgi:hypothetical protein